MNKRYDIEEHFEINDELAETIDDMTYRGIKVVYKYDTNTLVFYKNYGKIDEEDIDTIIYRNYNVSDIKKYIDEQILCNHIVYNGAEQQFCLTLGIIKLSETYRTLNKLNFSDCVLNELNDIVDDLMGLVEDETIKRSLLAQEIGYNKERDRYFVND